MKMLKSNHLGIFTILLLFLCYPLFGGTTGKITGIVTDAAGIPMPGVNIMIVGTNMGAATDVEGYYAILNIQPGSYSVKASFIGSKAETITDVRVFIDRTTNVNFTLEETSIVGEEVVVVAEREKIKTDVSYTQTSIDIKDMEAIPASPDIREVLSFAPGVYRNDRGQIEIRGGQMDEVGVYMDDISMQNSRTGVGVLNMPQSAIQEIQILRGGFSAEYGQAQAGIINIVTRQSQTNYSGSINVRYGAAQQKHFGPNMFSAENSYHVGRFQSMDPVSRSMPWTGEENTEIFQGWNNWWADTTNDRIDRYHPYKLFPYGSSAEEAREIWNWRHREQEYGNEPDYTVDGTLVGPVPFTSNKLDFFISGHYDRSMYPFRFYRSDYQELSLTGKLAYRITKDLSLKYHYIYSHQEGASRNSGSTNLADPRHWISSALLASEVFGSGGTSNTGMYNADGQTKLNEITNTNHALKFNYVLNNTSFINALVTFSKLQENMDFEKPYRNYTDIVKVIGGDSLDNAPYYPVTMVENQFVGKADVLGMHTLGAIDTRFDFSSNSNVTLKADYTNQINKIHMFQAGIWGMHTNMKQDFGIIQPSHDIEGNYLGELRKGWITKETDFYEFAAYAQDKIEFEGLIFSGGLRLDGAYNNEQNYPDWHSSYSKGFVADSLRAMPDSVAPRGDWKFYLSPRIGVAHPLTEYSKLFFNYGYFYQRPSVSQLFWDGYREDYANVSLTGLSSPTLDFRKTIQYELGYEQMVSDWFRITVSGYYRDITHNLQRTTLTDKTGWAYNRFFNTGIAEVRGFEIDIRIPKHYYVSGWASYDYRSNTSGGYGYTDYGENPAVGLTKERTQVSATRAQPIFKANITLHSPESLDNSTLNALFANWTASFQYQWESGQYVTWHANPALNEIDPFNIQWEDMSRLDLRIRKVFDIGKTELVVYLDVRNLLNQKYFHPALIRTLSNGKDYTKFTDDAYFSEIERLGLKPGNIEHPEIQNMLEQGAYWTFYGEPRLMWFGVEFNF